MLPLRYASRWRTASVILLLLVLAATMMPAIWIFPSRREFLIWFVGADKWLHGITFVFLAIWFAGLYEKRSYLKIGLGLTLFGLFIETCQRLVTYRSSDVFDIVADAAGISIGLLVAMAGMGGWSLWFENRFGASKAESDID